MPAPFNCWGIGPGRRSLAATDVAGQRAAGQQSVAGGPRLVEPGACACARPGGSAEFPWLCEARTGRGSERRRGHDPKGERASPGRCGHHGFTGWAIYKRGRIPEAIEILSRAAKGDPAEAEIHEHLGDALYQAGNRFEARYAWVAALQTAEDEVATRLKAKIETGLTPATAAP